MTLRERLTAAMVPVEETEFAKGVNRGLREAIEILDAYERELGDRVTVAMAAKREKSEKTGGDVPYGYRLASDGKTLRELPKEQRVISLARRLRESGRSLRDISAELDERGIRSRGGSKFGAEQIRRMVAPPDVVHPAA